MIAPSSHGRPSWVRAFGRRQRRYRYAFLRWWRLYEWHIVASMVVIAFVLGIIGFRTYLFERGEDATFLDAIYLAGQLFFNKEGGVIGDIPWTLQIARFLAPLATVFGVVRALTVVFARQLDQSRAFFARHHAVVGGLSRKGLYAALQLQADGRRAIVIERNQNNELIPQAREQGVLVLIGDATRADMLRVAGLKRADILIAVTSDDRVNIEIAAAGRTVERRSKTTLHCLAHVKDRELWQLLRELEVRWSISEGFVLECFNVYDRAAAAILNTFPTEDADGTGMRPSLVIADGEFGSSFLRHIALRRGEGAPDVQTRPPLYLLGCGADSQAANLKKWAGTVSGEGELVALPVDPTALAGGWSAVPDTAPDVHTFGRVFICMDEDAKALAPALALVDMLRGADTTVILCLQGGQGVETAMGVSESRSQSVGGLQVFNVIENMCRPDLLLGGFYESVARRVHELYVSSERAKPDGKREPDPSMREWDALDFELKDQNRAQAADIGAKLAMVGCDVVPLLLAQPNRAHDLNHDEIEILAKHEHRRWMSLRLEQGWRPGAMDRNTKTHPDLIPWERLPDGEREKDRNAVRAIPALLREAGYAIVADASERLARHIHEHYLVQHAADSERPGDPSVMVTWDSLSPDLKQANRDQAADIVAKLVSVGCVLNRLNDSDEHDSDDDAIRFAFTDNEIETLTRREHERWMRARAAQGWRVEDNADSAARTSPNMVAYDDLPESEKQKDRDVITQIPALVARAGYRVRRLDTAEPVARG